MDIVKGAVGCAVVALLAAHQLSTLDAGRRAALWGAARAVVGTAPPPPQPSPPAPPRPIPVAAAPAAFGEEAVAPDRFGQYRASVEIDGERLPALVDTGASFVALSAEDADRIGLRPRPADFRYTVSTANGPARSPRSSSPRCAWVGSRCATSRRWSAAAASSAKRCSA